MDRNDLADRLVGFSSALAREARNATSDPANPANAYLGVTWPISPDAHGQLLAAASALGAADVQVALNLATEYRGQLEHYTAQLAAGVPLHVIAEENAGIMRSVENTLCPALDRAAAELRATPSGPPASAKMSPRELAEKHGVDSDTLRKRLDRWRYDHDAGFIEVSNAARNEPRYLYDESAVMPVIEALRAKPAGRKRAADGQQKKI